MLMLYVPRCADLWFKQQLLSDPATMSYNHAYGGIIDFPEEKWAPWYKKWILCPESKRFYRYLADEFGTFIGEVAYHFDETDKRYLADVIVHSKYRGKGYGKIGLELLLTAAKANGLTQLCDEIAIDNPAIKLFLNCGFEEEYRTDKIVMLKKQVL